MASPFRLRPLTGILAGAILPCLLAGCDTKKPPPPVVAPSPSPVDPVEAMRAAWPRARKVVLATREMGHGQTDAAWDLAAACRAVIRAHPDDPEPHVLLARLWRLYGADEMAANEIREALAKSPRDPNAVLEDWVLKMRPGRRRAFEDWLSVQIGRLADHVFADPGAPSDPPPLRKSPVLDLAPLEAAAAALKEAEDPEERFARGLLVALQGRPGDVTSRYEGRSVPDDAAELLAGAALACGRPQDATAFLRENCRNHPGGRESLYLLGILGAGTAIETLLAGHPPDPLVGDARSILAQAVRADLDAEHSVLPLAVALVTPHLHNPRLDQLLELEPVFELVPEGSTGEEALVRAMATAARAEAGNRWDDLRASVLKDLEAAGPRFRALADAFRKRGRANIKAR